MNRTYMPMIDNGLFVAEYYLGKPYKEITIDYLYDNIYVFSQLIADKIENNEFYRNITYLTHMNSSFTQNSKKKSKETLIREQFENLLDNVGSDKYCIYCGKKQVNVNLEIDRKFMYGLVAQTFFNSANNLQTVDLCPVCAFLSLLSILNIQKIGVPTLYTSDDDNFMRAITKKIQLSSVENLDIDGNLKANELINATFLVDEIPNYVEQFCFMNSGQVVNDIERILHYKDIKLIRKLKNLGLLDKFIDYGLHNRLTLGHELITSEFYCSLELLNVLEEYDLKNKEREIIENVTKNLLEIESYEKLLKDLKLCNTKERFNNFILNYSSKRSLVEDIADYDILIGSNWTKFKNYINMNLMIYKNREDDNNGEQ